MSDDQARIRLMLDENINFVSRCLRHLGVHENEVDDYVQQAFITAHKKLDSIPEGKERAFLYRTVQFLAARARRSNAKNARWQREVNENDVAVGSPEITLDKKQLGGLLDQVLGTMKPELREVFVLHTFEDMTMAAIAATLKLPAGTVASRLRRAREVFSEEVRARWNNQVRETA